MVLFAIISCWCNLKKEQQFIIFSKLSTIPTSFLKIKLNLKIPTNFAHHGKNPQPITLNQTHFLVKNIPQNSKQINNKKKKNKTHLQPQSNWPYKIRTPNQYIYQIPQ